MDEVAEDLVQLYSARREKKGHQFGPDTVWQKEFEEMFPYEETDDQLTAIEETKKDMESDRIMDRLICGDVGYGKTEIAVRAAFKAVQEGMQVAVLVPTTILAQQHYNTFCERMRRYPVTVGMLSRFRSSAEQKQTIKEVSQGLCDIVIGTHRLLSKDVKFKDQEDEGKCGRSDPLRDADPQNPSYEPCGDPRHDGSGGRAGRTCADSDLRHGIR